MSLIATSGGTPQVLAGSISIDDIAVPLSVNTDDLNPSGGTLVSQFTLVGNAAINLTGIAGGTQNRLLTLLNSGASTITLKNNTTSAVGNRFIFGADVLLAANAIVEIQYNAKAGGWLLISSSAATSGGGATTGSILSPAALAVGQTDNYSPAGISTASILRLTPNAGGSQISGIVAPATAQIITVCNVGAANLTILNANAGSAAANKFTLPDDIVIVPNNSQTFFYDTVSTTWRTA